MKTSVSERVRKQGGEATRELLISTATRLFAQQGLDGVSLAEINRAAGQRNATALHYHFGGKEGMLQAVFDKHRPRVNALREEMLAALSERPKLQQVIAVLVAPLAEQVRDADGGADYLQFLGQVNITPDIPRDALDKTSSHILADQQRRFAQALESVPAEHRQLRSEFMLQMVFAALASYAKEVQVDGFKEQRHEQVVEQLTRSAAAVLAQ